MSSEVRWLKARVFAAYLDDELTEAGARAILSDEEFEKAMDWMDVADIIEPIDPDVENHIRREGDSRMSDVPKWGIKATKENPLCLMFRDSRIAYLEDEGKVIMPPKKGDGGDT